jgi:hypothetical protein
MVPSSLRTFLAREGLGALPREAMVLLEGGYAKLIERAPLHADWRGDLWTLGEMVQAGSMEPSSLFGIAGCSGETFGAMVMRGKVAGGIVTVAQAHASLEGLDPINRQQRVRTLAVEFADSNNPLLGNWGVVESTDEALRYNLLMAAELQWALRQALELPEVAFPDPLGEQLQVIDDGEMMHFHMYPDRNTVEWSIKH